MHRLMYRAIVTQASQGWKWCRHPPIGKEQQSSRYCAGHKYTGSLTERDTVSYPTVINTTCLRFQRCFTYLIPWRTGRGHELSTPTMKRYRRRRVLGSRVSNRSTTGPSMRSINVTLVRRCRRSHLRRAQPDHTFHRSTIVSLLPLCVERSAPASWDT